MKNPPLFFRKEGDSLSILRSAVERLPAISGSGDLLIPGQVVPGVHHLIRTPAHRL